MLKNDEHCWEPSGAAEAAMLSWFPSQGQYEALFEHSAKRWNCICAKLAEASIPAVAGRVLEFGAGMGLMDDILSEEVSRITMLDHSDAYMRSRPYSLSARAEFVPWKNGVLEKLKGPYDWLISMAVFYHIDLDTAAGLILELGKLLPRGGKVLVYGWHEPDPEALRKNARKRLFSSEPLYSFKGQDLSEAIEPEFRKLLHLTEWPTLVFEKLA